MANAKPSSFLEPYLDHMVLLVPHPVLASLPTWLTNNFTVLTGGRHASGATENKLIVFSDGSYFEIIAFLSDDPPSSSSSSWAKRTPAQFIDWACSAESSDGFSDLQSRVAEVQTGLVYTDLKAGGRTKPDGTVLKWQVSDIKLDKDGRKPSFEFVGGEAPFWCFDETPRQLRVPVNDKANTTHACGAVGVAEVAVYVKDPDLFASLEVLYSAIYAPVAAGDTRETHGRKRSFPLAAPNSSALDDREAELTVHLVGDDSGIDPEVFKEEQVHIKISLWSTKGSGKIAGHVGGRSEVVFDLVDLSA